jgi:hypothetical protein
MMGPPHGKRSGSAVSYLDVVAASLYAYVPNVILGTDAPRPAGVNHGTIHPKVRRTFVIFGLSVRKVNEVLMDLENGLLGYNTALCLNISI